MCFSAEASFGAGAVLGAAGVYAMQRCKKPSQRVFAAIPVFFAFQQVAEGFVWLTFTEPGWEVQRTVFAYIFLVFALLLWPVWLPFSVWLLEPQGKIKNILLAFAVIGVLFAVPAGFLLFSHSVFPEITGHHIHYELGFPGNLFKGTTLLYFIPTIIPPFISGWKSIRIFGLLLLLSYLISMFYFAHAVVSVWCFMAAIISIFILWALPEICGRRNLNTLK